MPIKYSIKLFRFLLHSYVLRAGPSSDITLGRDEVVTFSRSKGNVLLHRFKDIYGFVIMSTK